MNCEECKQRPATVHLTQMYNGQKKELHLCEQCAAQKGAYMFDLAKFSLPNLLGTFLGGNLGQQHMQAVGQARTCPNCGMNFADISQTGKLGCSECYAAFDSELEPTLRRVHGNSQHIGKVPARGGEKVMVKKQIEELKTRLQKAVAEEQYEKAAEISDSIKELEKKLS